MSRYYHATDYCCHLIVFPATWYEPEECYCEKHYDDEYECGPDCPLKFSKEDYDSYMGDRKYHEMKEEGLC